MFVCLHQMHYVFVSAWVSVCLYFLVFEFLCACTCMHESHICPDSVGFNNCFRALGLIALLQTQPSQNVSSQPLDTHKYTQTQRCREQCLLVFANVPPKAVDTFSVYTHMAHFSIGRLINLTRRWNTAALLCSSVCV